MSSNLGPTPIQRVAVWSKGLRISHWLMAACVPTLLPSGLALRDAAAMAGAWRDVHVTAGYLLGLALLARLVLLFAGRAPTDRWRDCLPRDRQQWLGARDTLLFYLSFGRSPPPVYYGHNPLWGPVYLALFAVIAAATITGALLAGRDPRSLLALTGMPWLFGWTLPEWHAGLAWTVAGFGAAHVLSVFAHDARGTASEISAMVNGHKVFVLPQSPRELAARIDIKRRNG